MTTRVRTINFLPEVFQTKTNKEFLAATLDQITNPPITMPIQGYIGGKLGFGVDAKDFYIPEPNNIRTDYQLEPGVIFTKPDSSTAKDFISYPGILDALNLEGGITDNNSRMFESQLYSWDSFTDLDKLINYNQYYWLPSGPPAVTVATSVVFSSNEYIVTDLANGYNIREFGATAGAVNPTITLLRGGTYRFIVNQPSEFWIQGEPSVTGFSLTQPNLPVRDVFGVFNNGANQGIVTFNVPAATAQDEFIFPGNNLVNVVSTLPFSQINGARLSDLGNIDGITSLENLRIMFYNTGIPNEVGYISAYYDEGTYDTNIGLVNPLTVTVGSTTTSSLILSSGTTDDLELNSSIIFSSPAIGGLSPNQVYYVSSILSSTEFTVTDAIGNPDLTLTASTGSMVAVINQGLYEEGFYTTVADNFYRVTYIGNPSDPVIRLIPDGQIPTEEKITATSGTTWVNREFYKNVLGIISLVPYITAPLDTLYYQDGTSSNKVGVIKLIDSNLTNSLNVENEILGQTKYTSPTGIVFTNGLKVRFDGDVTPSQYLQGEYYVEGVGTSIELVPVNSLISPEIFTSGDFIPYDTTPYDTTNFDSELFVPVDPDYITISRNSISKNPWSRSNRWTHIDVIQKTSVYNNNPEIVNLASTKNKAKRPIIEFYPNIKLFNSGTNGKAAIDFIDSRTKDALSAIAGLERYYPDVEVYTENTGVLQGVTGDTTTFTIPTTDIIGTFQTGQYVSDYLNILPINSQITNIDQIGDDTEITISWPVPASIGTSTDIALVGTRAFINNYEVFSGARIIFAADEDPTIRNKIFVVNVSQIDPTLDPVITLTEAPDSVCEPGDQTVVLRGFNNQGNSFYYDGIEWKLAQQKTNVNQSPLFDVFDENGISFGDETLYKGTSFVGSKLFNYGIGSGSTDPILGFPVRYSTVDVVGDISFDVSFNTDEFDYVTGTEPVTRKVNTGYVFNFISKNEYVRELGWKTAVAESVQYQVFEFKTDIKNNTGTFVCDIPALPDLQVGEKGWARVQVYVNNACQCAAQFSYSVVGETTIIQLLDPSKLEDETIVQALVLSDKVSNMAYYTVPANLSNNPFNQDLETVSTGDIRIQYRDIYVNAPEMTGPIFGSNNFRDLGNLVSYGSKIIKNSASLVLPGTFLRKNTENLFDALTFNNNEYIKYKNLLVDTVNTIDLERRFTPAEILEKAVDIITQSKSETQAFFWSDMMPTKAPYKVSTYEFNNELNTSIYPLTKIYETDRANYNGVLVYLTKTIDSVKVEKQLIKGKDYLINTESPSLKITLLLEPNDVITIKEYNQTYGSYVPNTPTKLGLYPAHEPKVILDTGYFQPTYFILGHDGSYNKLFGSYNEEIGVLEDFRDQALLEFESRIFNNLKLDEMLPIQLYEILPGFFRNTDYSYEEFMQMYTPLFLNWVGQNRIDYKSQFFNRLNEYTYNYSGSGNNVNGAPVEQGYWRGVYQYFYDTTTPDTTPWEMLAFAEKPNWWDERYGPAPYTKDNLILWNDLENGFVWNNGNSFEVEKLKRPGLMNIIPVDENGNIVAPLQSVIGNFTSNNFQKDWKVGDIAPVELSYRRSSSFPFDLMKLFAVMKPAKFFNLAVDLDNYRYNPEFNQYLVDKRGYLQVDEIELYGDGTAKTSYINWIIDYSKQLGVDSTTETKTLLDNLDVRLVYRLAGYSDKDLLKFFIEKGTPNSRNASLLIPDESYSILLYDNQPFDRLVFSGIIIQSTQQGYAVFGNSQTTSYFKTLRPLNNGKNNTIDVENLTVKVASDYTDYETIVPYGTVFFSEQELSQFIAGYSAYLRKQGLITDSIVAGIEINWNRMIAEFLYWSQSNWEIGSIISLNPSAETLTIQQENAIVQPLTIQQTNFVLNQNLYPIQAKDLSVYREDTLFSVSALNRGDSISYGQFNLSNFEHGIVFDNYTLFNDTVYNLTTGLRQQRLYVQGTKTAEWNGTVNASGFILSQDNIEEWSKSVKYTKGSIVLFKNKYWTAVKVVEPQATFNKEEWKEINYDAVQKGLIPNSSTRSVESALYYDCDKANLEKDADLLSYSLIGFRPRDYMSLVDLTDITQINVYKNFIKNKGTRSALQAFKGANLPQGGIDYDVYENWAIKTSNYGGVLNKNFVDFKLNEQLLTGNPAIVSLTNGFTPAGTEQTVNINNLYNYGSPIATPDILKTVSLTDASTVYPSAGYVNFNDVKIASYFYSGLNDAVNKLGENVSIQDFYVGDYAWLANYIKDWDVLSWKSIGVVLEVRNNLNNTATVTFAKPHNLSKLDPLALINISENINGYYIVSSIVNLNEVIIDTSFTGPAVVTGIGIGLTFNSQRVSKPADIATLPLTETQFTSNTVWVDEGEQGNWQVYRKDLNYKNAGTVTKVNSETFGSAVAYSPTIGYMFSDAVTGEVYRYDRPQTLNNPAPFETLVGGASFGSAIAHANSTVVITEPTGNSIVHVYVLNDSFQTNDLTECTPIPAPMGVTNWGQSIAISGDTNWLYISDTENNKVYVYRKQSTQLPATSMVNGQTYIINEVGDTDFTAVGSIENTNNIVFVATGPGTGTGQVTQITYEEVEEITVSGLQSDDNFGKTIATTYTGDKVYIGAPNVAFDVNISNWGNVFAFSRSVQKIEIKFTTTSSQTLDLTWTPTGPLYVLVNGTLISETLYTISGNTVVYNAPLQVGDIVEISGSQFTLEQTFNSLFTNRVGIQFGTGLDTTKFGTEVLIGAPFEISEINQEGSVYRFTNAGERFGMVIGTSECIITQPRIVHINDYPVTLPIGTAETTAATINQTIPNVLATATPDNKLIIQLIDKNLAVVNKKLSITSTDSDTIGEMGIEVYKLTQIITSPNLTGPTEFGSVVKFNEHDSVIIGAPTSTRLSGVFFDNSTTIFDNNATQFVDASPNAGAVYIYDYLSNYEETQFSVGKFVFAQSVNSNEQVYGFNPRYGSVIDFNSNVVVVGSPNFLPESVDGQVTIFENETGIKNWTTLRVPGPVVDTDSIQNAQLYSAETNNTLVNLDYIDPLQGKLLGSVRQNLDFVSPIDPAGYNSTEVFEKQTGLVWGEQFVGKTWLDTANIRFMNYQQNDIVYNSEYWGEVFPGSDVIVYTWIKSTVPPSEYEDSGTPKDDTLYVVSTEIDSSNLIVPVYYFWVRNTNQVFREEGKTLSDTIIESYIKQPKKSGVSFFAPIRPDTFAIYNSQEFFNGNDTVFHVGYSVTTTEDESHAEYTLIRENFTDDFLPGLPRNNETPEGLYDRLLDSLAGVDEVGGIVPDPFLPKAVQTGILARPRQSFFYNRFLALKNYLTYANIVLAQFPIRETRPDISLLFASGEFYDTSNYWEFTNWWAPGYDDNTKSSIQIQVYADLLTLNVSIGTIVTVENSNSGTPEIYRFDENNTWTRIGLQNGTIKFKVDLWDYSEARIGFGDNFYDTVPYDQYPSEETRYIIRALNEQIYINELLPFRNKSLILLFQYIQSEGRESQNYLPWLNKTSLVDINHLIRELKPIQVYQNDNQEFLEGYVEEVKPYHVVIKEFLFKYKGQEAYLGNFTDFDLPAEYNNSLQKYISPNLVYNTVSQDNEYLPTDSIWQSNTYNEWFTNRGIKLSSIPNYKLTTLSSYVPPAATFMFVDNAQGFPINGVITIGDEQIAYSTVDRGLNLITGLSRGFNNTLITQHIPGDKIFIDLPEIVVLDGSRGYQEPPRVTAHIDLEKYPAPIKEAQLEAVMSLDSVLSVKVIDPGQGYAVTPEIKIDPATILTFTNSDINSITHVISVFAPNLITGSLVKFNKGTYQTGIGNLANDSWYYVNVLETTPVSIIALYTNYSDAINDKNRIEIFDIGFNDELTLSVGARAFAITSASPVRELDTTIRFDRTTYGSQVKDWRSGIYYSSFFAGSYFNSSRVSSSSIKLESTTPDITDILASSQGITFEIAAAENRRDLTWSSLLRKVGSTISATNAVRLIPLDDGSINPNSSGSTIGFYENMPVKFEGAAISGLVVGETYYVRNILNDTDFTISSAINGSELSLTDQTVSIAGLSCYAGEVTDIGVITINYPGILQVTNTQANTNRLTVPTTLIGTGGTQGFYTNLPVFFTENVFGGIRQNDIYYVTTVIDNQTFTISEFENPVTTTVTATSSVNDYITVSNTTGFANGDPIIFTKFIVSGLPSATFGNLVAGTTYFVSEIINDSTMTISATLNGPIFDPGTETGTGNVTNQKDTLNLTTAQGSMTMNVSLPVSPGQIDGQLFTFYNTSLQYPELTGTNSDLIIRDCLAVIETVDRIAVSIAGGTTNLYVNMPLRFIDPPVGSGLDDTTTYYIVEYSGQPDPDPFNQGEFLPNIQVEITNTSSSGNTLLCDDVSSLYLGMPIVFSGIGLGGVVIDQQYFVDTIDEPNNTITIKDIDDNQIVLTNDNGLMIGTGPSYIKVSTSKGGSSVTISATLVEDFKFEQVITSPAEYSVSYKLGGYSVIVTDPGEGYAINNTIKITGDLLGGTSPKNDLVMTVNVIDTDGGITDVIPAGVVADIQSKYYLKVISDTEAEIYADPLLKIPVSGLNLVFGGFVSSTVTDVTAGANTITVDNVSEFEVNDKVIFNGNTQPLEAGISYYIVSIDDNTNEIAVSLTPAGTPVVIPSTTQVDFTMTKAGSYIYLPEPFYFDQSIVRFKNRLYVCLISNNDTEFVFGKWQLIDSGDRRLNAMDRAVGYYQPTLEMPGLDLAQLFTGVTYPNTTYLGNPFAPADQYILDTTLQPQPFKPTGVNIIQTVWDGEKYLAIANTSNYISTLGSLDGETWLLAKLTNIGSGVTDIIFANGIYVVTSTNVVTPIFRSSDGITWTTTGFTNNSQSVQISALSLNSVVFENGLFIAVGNGIVTSSDTYSWTDRLSFVNPSLTNTLFDVTSVNIPAFSGYVAVGKGQIFDFSTGLTQIVDTNISYYSTDGLNWIPSSNITPSGWLSVASNNNLVVAVGENGVIYYSENGVDWFGSNETTVISVNSVTDVINVGNTTGLAVDDVVRFNNDFSSISSGTDYYIVDIISETQIQISTSIGGSPVILTPGTVPFRTLLRLQDNAYETLNSMVYGNGTFIAVGNQGTIRTSVDGILWTTVTTGFVVDFNNVAYKDNNTFLVVGTDTILTSTDAGVTWISTDTILEAPAQYDVVGDDFEFGYAPEELVAGNVTDNITLLVNTRPGTNWPVEEYAHTGYNVKSVEFVPSTPTQTDYYFGDIVQYPIEIFVAVIDTSSGLSTTLYENIDYTVDWVNLTVILNNPIVSLPVSETLRIDAYEVGNGDQLVKSNTKVDPIRTNTLTGFNEIKLNCNYSAPIFLGSGVVQPQTFSTDVFATATFSGTNQITVDSVKDLVINEPVRFRGSVFGGIVENQQYFIKSVSAATNTITISETINFDTGIAGPIFNLISATGLMVLSIDSGPGLVWTDPLVFHNGDKLVFGKSNIAIQTKTINNAIVTSSTSGMIVGSPITFCICEIENSGIDPLTTYYIESIISLTEFTISETQFGPVKSLGDGSGRSLFITNDYAVVPDENGVSAKLIFANSYDQNNDLLSFVVFGETFPEEYGYTVPETQIFTGDNIEDTFNLDNFVGGVNPQNAIVEINGLRINTSQYTIDTALNEIEFVVAPGLGDVIAVTTFNDTQRQYLNTQTSVIGTAGVTEVININNAISAPLATTVATASTNGAPNEITVLSTVGFVENQTVIFKGTSFDANVETDGTVYFVDTIVDSTTFKIKDRSNNLVVLAGGTGNMLVEVGGNPTVRVTTSIDHNFTENQLIRIDGIEGSIQLNNNLYYAKIINDTVFDVYAEPYDPTENAVNSPLTLVSSYISGGYVWVSGLFSLSSLEITDTTTITNIITATTTNGLIPRTPILFSATDSLIGDDIMGGIIQGTTYYVREVLSGTEFTISEERDGSAFALSTDSGTIGGIQWEQVNVDRLWVTINGLRVPSSRLKLNSNNELSILTTILPSDEVIITSMMPYATPDQELYINFVNTVGEGSVYRTNSSTKTWLTQPLYDIDTEIHVNDVRKLTNTIEQQVLVPSEVSGVYSIGILGDKRTTVKVSVFNLTKNQEIDQQNYSVVVEQLSPILKIKAGSYIDTNDEIIITILEGNLLYLNGEQIRFAAVDFNNNIVSLLERGANNTAIQTVIQQYTTVYGLLSKDKLSNILYNQTWNSNNFNESLGDPLQISSTEAAEFLNMDNSR